MFQKYFQDINNAVPSQSALFVLVLALFARAPYPFEILARTLIILYGNHGLQNFHTSCLVTG